MIITLYYLNNVIKNKLKILTRKFFRRPSNFGFITIKYEIYI